MAALIYAAIDFDRVIELFTRFVDWVRLQPFESSLAIVGIFICLVLLTMPVLYLSVALGFAFSSAFNTKLEGYFYGLFIVSFGIILAGVITMLVSRHLLSKVIRKRFLVHHRSFVAMDSVIASEGIKTVFLLRMTPIPFAVASYLLGVTSVKLKDYFLGTLAMVIHVAMWIYIGQSFT